MKVIIRYFAETARKFVALHFNKSINSSKLPHIMRSSLRASGISRLTVKIKKKITELFPHLESVVLICGLYNMIVSFILSRSGLTGDKHSLEQPRVGAQGGSREEGRQKVLCCTNR